MNTVKRLEDRLHIISNEYEYYRERLGKNAMNDAVVQKFMEEERAIIKELNELGQTDHTVEEW